MVRCSGDAMFSILKIAMFLIVFFKMLNIIQTMLIAHRPLLFPTAHAHAQLCQWIGLSENEVTLHRRGCKVRWKIEQRFFLTNPIM